MPTAYVRRVSRAHKMRTGENFLLWGNEPLCHLYYLSSMHNFRLTSGFTVIRHRMASVNTHDTREKELPYMKITWGMWPSWRHEQVSENELLSSVLHFSYAPRCTYWNQILQHCTDFLLCNSDYYKCNPSFTVFTETKKTNGNTATNSLQKAEIIN
jgi:hypothetical protein